MDTFKNYLVEGMRESSKQWWLFWTWVEIQVRRSSRELQSLWSPKSAQDLSIEWVGEWIMKERIELPAIIITQVRRALLNNYSLCNMAICTRVLSLPGIEAAGKLAYWQHHPLVGWGRGRMSQKVSLKSVNSKDRMTVWVLISYLMFWLLSTISML